MCVCPDRIDRDKLNIQIVILNRPLRIMNSIAGGGCYSCPEGVEQYITSHPLSCLKLKEILWKTPWQKTNVCLLLRQKFQINVKRSGRVDKNLYIFQVTFVLSLRLSLLLSFGGRQILTEPMRLMTDRWWVSWAEKDVVLFFFLGCWCRISRILFERKFFNLTVSIN